MASAFGFTAPSSGSQSLATVNYRPSVYAQSSTANLQTALAVASAVPLIGSVASLSCAVIDAADGNYGGVALGVAGAIPFMGSMKAVGRTADVLLDVARVEGGRYGQHSKWNSTPYAPLKMDFTLSCNVASKRRKI